MVRSSPPGGIVMRRSHVVAAATADGTGSPRTRRCPPGFTGGHRAGDERGGQVLDGVPALADPWSFWQRAALGLKLLTRVVTRASRVLLRRAACVASSLPALTAWSM